MFTTDREVENCLTLLRNLIRQKGFTQLDVQQALGWGRSYISQLLTKQKALRYEQILLMLNVIGVSPEEFFAELFPALQQPAPTRRAPARSGGAPIRQTVGTTGAPRDRGASRRNPQPVRAAAWASCPLARQGVHEHRRTRRSRSAGRHRPLKAGLVTGQEKTGDGRQSEDQRHHTGGKQHAVCDAGGLLAFDGNA